MDATEHAALMKRMKRADTLRNVGLALGISGIPAFGLAITFIQSTLVSLALLIYAPTAVLVGVFIKSSGDDIRRRALKDLGAPLLLGRVAAPLPVARVVEREDGPRQ